MNPFPWLFATQQRRLIFTTFTALISCVAACTAGQDAESSEEDIAQVEETPWDANITADDFGCLTDYGTRVGHFYMKNVLGKIDDAIAVANNPDGGMFPEGTFVSWSPTTPMVKRSPGYSPETGDWEYFVLDIAPDGTTRIYSRGIDAIHPFGFTCLECHEGAADKWDYICEDHLNGNEFRGCDSMGLGTEDMEPDQLEQYIHGVQANDPRCQE